MGKETISHSDSHGVLQLIVHISEKSKSEILAVSESLGIPPALARPLLLLGKPEAMSSLAEHLSCDRSYITGITDQLEERGLVERISGEDRRVKLLKLTTKGKNLRNRLADGIVQESPILNALSNKERKMLLDLLGKLTDKQIVL